MPRTRAGRSRRALLRRGRLCDGRGDKTGGDGVKRRSPAQQM